jgi:mRNA-degrading endonuclease YafQ of YafQ-DinJ toxin-antitoxin module
MPNKYTLSPKLYFTRKYVKLIKNNQKLMSKIEAVFGIMYNDPFAATLKTHKVRAKIGFEAYSSRVSGDIRIIWNFDKDKIWIIDLFDIGGHSGSQSVY